MKNFSKKNEKEKMIELKSFKVSWGYTLVFIILLINYEFYKNGKFDILLTLLLISQSAVYFLSKLFYLKIASNHGN